MSRAGYVRPLSPAALKAAAARQPIAIGIDAEWAPFHSYTGGVITSPDCGETIDHGVLLIGYGTDQATGLDYWLVKNSWGSDWGENGHFRVLRSSEEGTVGICGLGKESSFPIV